MSYPVVPQRRNERPEPAPSRNRAGLGRAFQTIILLTLYRCGEINDIGGSAGRELLVRAGITVPTTPQGLSNALHALRGAMTINTEVDGSRTYAIWMDRRLTAATVEALRRDEPWAKALILNQKPLPSVSGIPPEIRLEPLNIIDAVDPGASEDTKTADNATTPGQFAGGQAAANSQPSTLPTASEAALMAYIVRLETELRRLRGALGLHDADDELSPSAAAFLRGRQQAS